MANIAESGSDRGWLCLSKPTEEHGRVGEGYDDVLGESYVWTADLQNGRSIASGDVIAIWDGDKLLGVSRIEGDIEDFEGLRVSFSCPSCGSADVRFRKTSTPKYRCAKCHWLGEVPNQLTETRIFRRARYAAGWSEIQAHVSAENCRQLAKRPKSQHSLRELDFEKLEAILSGEAGVDLAPFRRRTPELHGGHVLRTVRTRKGQGLFRERMLQKYARTCAFTGSNHDSALEAAHLYRYAEIGQHFEDGGLLLRRDVHRLFDRGLLAVNPGTQLIDVHPDLAPHPSYASLAGMPLQVKIPSGAKAWLALHWEEHRSPL